MKSWLLNKRVNCLSEKIDNSIKTDTRLDFSSFSEAEQRLFCSINSITEKYASSLPPKDVLNKNIKLWNKGLEILGRRITELFVDSIPTLLLCDDLERWYFKLYYYNFWLDWKEKIKSVREMPEEQRNLVISDYRESGVFDMVFRFSKGLERNEAEGQ